jgi:hypothetical protein
MVGDERVDHAQLPELFDEARTEGVAAAKPLVDRVLLVAVSEWEMEAEPAVVSVLAALAAVM